MTDLHAAFVAINYIDCEPSYRERFETLFGTRAHAIDQLPGFQKMMVLKPQTESESYLVVSFWDSEADFQHWMKSEAFHEGHRRGFGDLKKAAEENRTAPMKSTFKTYNVIAR